VLGIHPHDTRLPPHLNASLHCSSSSSFPSSRHKACSLHEPQTLALTLTLTQLQCADSALLSLAMALQIFHAKILAIQLPSFVQLQWEKLAENGEILLSWQTLY
jgi:hypothetical protein